LPGDTNASLGLAGSLFHSQEYEEALSTLTKLLQEHPDLAEAEFLAGASLLNLQQPQAAVPYLKRSLKADPQSHATEAALGQALLQEGKPEEAIPYLKSGVRADADGNAHYQLFRAYQLIGNRQLARQAFDEYTRYRTALDEKRREQSGAPVTEP
jgi:predicted Zn-dependent protease